jgi:hypothetical protein
VGTEKVGDVRTPGATGCFAGAAGALESGDGNDGEFAVFVRGFERLRNDMFAAFLYTFP